MFRYYTHHMSNNYSWVISNGTLQCSQDHMLFYMNENAFSPESKVGNDWGYKVGKNELKF